MSEEFYFAFVDLMSAYREYHRHQEDTHDDSYDPHEHHYSERIDAARKRFEAGFKDAVREVLAELGRGGEQS